MKEIKQINAAIIDDEPGAISKLKEVLQDISKPKLNIVFTSTDPLAGYRKTLEYKPDILFLDINMPGKSGIELLRELKDHSEFDCYVVFQTAYQQYILQALREAAFDFFHKPVQYADVANMLNRYLNIEYGTGFREKIDQILIEGNKRIELPTNAGLQFLQENEIVACEYISHEKGVKPYWAAITIDNRKIMLRRNIKGKDLINNFLNEEFYLINSGTIINLNFLSMVDYKNRLCLMVPPFENPNYVIARGKLASFKERFDKIN
nr:response regulator transcription factor [uncultured Draconibacterium sp.]